LRGGEAAARLLCPRRSGPVIKERPGDTDTRALECIAVQNPSVVRKNLNPRTCNDAQPHKKSPENAGFFHRQWRSQGEERAEQGRDIRAFLGSEPETIAHLGLLSELQDPRIQGNLVIRHGQEQFDQVEQHAVNRLRAMPERLQPDR
jgi:hypothetical protein